MTEAVHAAAVLGNVNLDVVCKTVDDVPRKESLLYQEGVILPGGNGSNTAIGLAVRGITTYLIAQTGVDFTAEFLKASWKQAGIDDRWVRTSKGVPTGTSVVLVDSSAQPRFIHTPGANSDLEPGVLDADKLLDQGVEHLHIAGYFVLPGLLKDDFSRALGKVRSRGITISLDVVSTPGMSAPEALWACLPAVDIFLCNRQEAGQLLGIHDPEQAARSFRDRGARAVILKLGEHGCWLNEGNTSLQIPAPEVEQILDTTGAGDAFAAGLITALLEGKNLPEACRRAGRAGADVIGHLGAVSPEVVSPYAGRPARPQEKEPVRGDQ
jgi:sugar/nucleoside kinase (ribokinase family)